MKKALVIGAAGFVGGYLIDCLKSEFGYEVYGTKIVSQGFTHPNAEILDLDIMQKAKSTPFFQESGRTQSSTLPRSRALPFPGRTHSSPWT